MDISNVRFVFRVALAVAVVLLVVGLYRLRTDSTAVSRTQEPGLSSSRITSLDVVSRTPAFGGRSFGSVGPYELIVANAKALADPRAHANGIIVGIADAPRNAAGLVEYSFDVQILKPADVARGNGVLLYEFVNRGSSQVVEYFLEGLPPLTHVAYEEGHVGNAFLMTRGYTVVMSGWQAGEAFQPVGRLPRLFARLPFATDAGRPIVGTTREEWIRGTRQIPRRLSYPASSLDRANAVLTARINEADPRRVVPASRWSFRDESTIEIQDSPNADAGTIYELVYQATKPVVMGLGLAAVRDLVSFLRYQSVDDQGHANPLFASGRQGLRVAVSSGTSQAGRVQRDFLYLGFNRDVAGRKVFDGINPIIAGARQTFLNYRFSQPGRFTRQHEDHLFPMADFPFTYGTTTDALTGKTDGLLARCSASQTCPKVIQVDSESEAYQAYGSLVVTDTTGRVLRLPDGVRYYFLTTAHLWAFHEEPNPCRDAMHGVWPGPYYRAAFDALVQWVRDGVPPPPSRAPSVSDGTFVPVSDQRRQYPAIPQRPFNDKINELGVRDYRVNPPKEGQTRYPVFVPALDRDGNPVAGVRVPEIVAPLGTLSARAVRAKGFAEGELCDVYGSFIPFARTRAQRLASGDSRLSLEERYPKGQPQYANHYRRAIEHLVAERYLLPEDGARMIAATPSLPAR